MIEENKHHDNIKESKIDHVMMPIPAKIISLKIDLDKPKFNIINGYLSPCPGYYSYYSEDILDTIFGGITIKLVIPRQILGYSEGYEIPIGQNVFNDLTARVRINENNTMSSIITVDNDNVGWITFTIFVFGLVGANIKTQINAKAIPNLHNNICSIHYCINFASLKLKVLYSHCKKKNYGRICSKDVVELKSSTYLEISEGILV